MNKSTIFLLSSPTVLASMVLMFLFGCDCIKSINALRQMRGIALGVEGDRILPGSPIKTCSENRLR